jgi:hypothetical protein
VNCLVAAALVMGFTSIASWGAPSIAHADAVGASGDGLPDPTARLLRWPLSASEHPELAPRYAVAKDLAEPGLDWLELCKLGAHKRTVPSVRDQTAYLGAWCAIANHDVDTGIAGLQRLASSTVRGLAAAIRVDLSNVLANEGEHATELIARHRIRDVVVVDRAVALFIDMNKLAAADELNDIAIGFGERSPGSCERQARRIVMNPDAYRGPGIARRTLLRGAACRELDAELGCWIDLGRCGAYFKQLGRRNVVPVFELHRAFIEGREASIERMYEEIEKLTTERDLSLVLDVLVRSLQPACPDPARQQSRNAWWRITFRDKLQPAIKARIERLLEEHERCVR